VHYRNRSRLALMGATLWLVSGCQSSSFVSHEERVSSGTSVPVDLQVAFGPGQSSGDGQMVACLSLPEGWSAPEGTYTYNGAAAVQARPDVEVTAEALASYGAAGGAWHCFTSERITIGQDGESTGTARLALPVPAVAQGTYRLTYATGFRPVKPPDETDAGTELPPAYQATSFSGRLERVLHVNVSPATTFDTWRASSFGTSGVLASATAVTYGNGHFLALAETSLFTSVDGREWTDLQPRLEGSEDPISVDAPVFAFGRWFALSAGSVYASADDGRTWARAYQDPPPEDSSLGRDFMALAASGTRVVAVGRQGLIAVTSDGVTWTDQSQGTDHGFQDVVAGQDTFLVVGEPEDEAAPAGHRLLRASADGSNWDTLPVEAFAGREIGQLVSGNGRFLAFTWKPSEDDGPIITLAGETPPEEPAGRMYLSEDRGATWQPVQGLQAPDSGLSQATLLAFMDRSFVVAPMLTQLETQGTLLPLELHASADGRTWTTHATGAAGSFTSSSFATGPQTVVAVSSGLSLVAERKPWAGPELVTESLPYAVVGVAYNATVEARGGGGSTTLALEGTVPAGLSFSAGVFSGVPTAAGTSSVTVTASDVRDARSSRTYSLEVVPVLAVAGGELANAVQGRAYEASVSATGGRAPFTWSHAGTLPEGLTLAQRGDAYVVSGTPVTSTATQGAFALDVKVTDASGQSAQRMVVLKVDPAPAPPPQEDESCGCSGSGAASMNALGLAALALMRRSRRRK
jgi:hypothetical protein